MRANANPPSRGSAPRVGSRASAPSAGRCSEKVHSHSGVAPRHLANDQVEGSDGARTGRVKTWGSSGRGGFGRCGVLREFVRARWVRACVRVAWSAARRPRPRPAVVAKKYLAFCTFSPSHMANSLLFRTSKSLRETFSSSGTSGLHFAWPIVKKANQRPFDRVSVGFHRSSASLVGRTHRILFHARILQRILMIAFFAR